MSDYHACLVNCTLCGIEFTTVTEAAGKLRKVRNLIRLNANGFEFELYQNPDRPDNLASLRGKQVVTTDVFVRDIVEDAAPKIRETIDKLCELLSFATLVTSPTLLSRISGRFWERKATDRCAAFAKMVWPCTIGSSSPDQSAG